MLKTLFRQFRLWVIRRLQGNTPLSVESFDNLVVLAPHPDDETMGCGQLLARAVKQGIACKVLVVSDGTGAHQNCCSLDENTLANCRRLSCRKALKVLGLSEENLVFMGFPDGKLHQHVDEIFNRVLEQINGIHCTLLVPHELEGWGDHKAITLVGKRLAVAKGYNLLSYCVWFYFSMPFRFFYKVKWHSAKTLCNIEDCQKKQAALAIYHNDKAPCGQPYAGGLPSLLWQAVNDECEVFFEG
ncbi:MAG: PIG-L family deacetylase [Spirochaetia bacterium]|nr:PIG-L family deacetylase [Spirochaetia bacterium]